MNGGKAEQDQKFLLNQQQLSSLFREDYIDNQDKDSRGSKELQIPDPMFNFNSEVIKLY